MITIRKAVFEDYYGVLSLADEQLGQGYLKGVLKFTFEHPLWIAESKATNELVGFVYVVADKFVSTIKSIAVKESYQNKRVGSKLMQRVLKDLHPITDQIEVYAWEKSDTKEIPLEKMLKDFGFERSKQITKAWYLDSVKRNYECPSCGNPCVCSAVVFSSPSSYFATSSD